MKIILEGQIEGIASRVDGTVVLKFSTQELDQSKAGELFGLRGKHCKALFSDSNITKLESELVDNTTLVQSGKNKTPSQRLRAVLYLLNKQYNGKEDDTFYNAEMEKLIELYKKKLE